MSQSVLIMNFLRTLEIVFINIREVKVQECRYMIYNSSQLYALSLLKTRDITFNSFIFCWCSKHFVLNSFFKVAIFKSYSSFMNAIFALWYSSAKDETVRFLLKIFSPPFLLFPSFQKGHSSVVRLQLGSHLQIWKVIIGNYARINNIFKFKRSLCALGTIKEKIKSKLPQVAVRIIRSPKFWH